MSSSLQGQPGLWYSHCPVLVPVAVLILVLILFLLVRVLLVRVLALLALLALGRGAPSGRGLVLLQGTGPRKT